MQVDSRARALVHAPADQSKALAALSLSLSLYEAYRIPYVSSPCCMHRDTRAPGTWTDAYQATLLTDPVPSHPRLNFHVWN